VRLLNLFLFANKIPVMIRALLTPALSLLFSIGLLAQTSPVKWSFSANDLGNCQVELIFTGAIDDGWFTYSQYLESEDGPVPTSITFQEDGHFKLLGNSVESGDIITVHDKVFDMNLTKFKHQAIITQRVEVLDPSKPITGFLNFMSCNDEICLPPKNADFRFKIPGLSACNPKTSNN